LNEKAFSHLVDTLKCFELDIAAETKIVDAQGAAFAQGCPLDEVVVELMVCLDLNLVVEDITTASSRC
jgi:hypothetical protein